jgi:hypothetical protein
MDSVEAVTLLKGLVLSLQEGANAYACEWLLYWIHLSVCTGPCTWEVVECISLVLGKKISSGHLSRRSLVPNNRASPGHEGIMAGSYGETHMRQHVRCG